MRTLLEAGGERTARADRDRVHYLQQGCPSYSTEAAPLLYVYHEGASVLVNVQRVVMMHFAEKELHLATDYGEVYSASQLSIVGLITAFPGVWVRTSRDFAVRVDSISHIRGQWCFLVSGEKAPISRRQRGAFLARAYLGTARRILGAKGLDGLQIEAFHVKQNPTRR